MTWWVKDSVATGVTIPKEVSWDLNDIHKISV